LNLPIVFGKKPGGVQTDFGALYFIRMNIAEEQKYHPENLQIDTIDGMTELHLRWIVSGDSPFQITIDSNKGGLVKSKVN